MKKKKKGKKASKQTAERVVYLNSLGMFEVALYQDVKICTFTLHHGEYLFIYF